MLEQGTFLYELWVARWALLQGVGATVLISALAILLGTVLGIFVGLVLIYGRWVSRFAVPHVCRLRARHAGVRAGAGQLLHLLTQSASS